MTQERKPPGHPPDQQQPEGQKQPGLKEIARYPVAHVLWIMGALVSAVVTAFITTNLMRSSSAEDRADVCETRLYEVSTENRQLTRDLLISQGALDRVAPAVDSLRKNQNK